MATLEEAGKNNPNLRQVFSKGKGGGKIWEINLDSSFDIDVMTKTNLVSVKT